MGDLNQMLAQFIRAQLTLAAFSLIVYTRSWNWWRSLSRWCWVRRAE